jgi:hypothetical protein
MRSRRTIHAGRRVGVTIFFSGALGSFCDFLAISITNGLKMKFLLCADVQSDRQSAGGY